MTFLPKSVRRLFIGSVLLTLIGFFTLRDVDSPYQRSINGDGKGYYAYLPAIFIYGDLDYHFVESMDAKYYPEDGTHNKIFKNKQRNGRYVNKYFPGVSILYLPFFLLSMLAAWISGYPVDGYSLPFQLGIGLAHVFYYFMGTWLLLRVMAQLLSNRRVLLFWLLAMTFGTNCWYYLVYDHTVTHLFIYFLFCQLIYCWYRLAQSKDIKWLGRTVLLLCLILIVRPTGLMVVTFLPLLSYLFEQKPFFFVDIVKTSWRRISFFVIGGLVIVSVAPILWKLQSGLWLVYSYNEEGFDFLHPQTWNYLFSYQKGWLLWTPMMAVCILLALIGLAYQGLTRFLTFLLPLSLVVYVLSSWWCWTYGAGFGQRTMIEYYPFVLVAAVPFLNRISHGWFWLLTPLMALNLIQNYQVFRGIYNGGSTTKEQYWAHFLQLKTSAPTVNVPKNWERIDFREVKSKVTLSKSAPFSPAVESDSLSGKVHLVVKTTVGGDQGDNSTALIVSDATGSFYQAVYLAEYLYETPREMAFRFDPPAGGRFKAYLWNSTKGDSKAEFVSISMAVYK